jgi:hypothetical protein
MEEYDSLKYEFIGELHNGAQFAYSIKPASMPVGDCNIPITVANSVVYTDNSRYNYVFSILKTHLGYQVLGTCTFIRTDPLSAIKLNFGLSFILAINPIIYEHLEESKHISEIVRSSLDFLHKKEIIGVTFYETFFTYGGVILIHEDDDTMRTWLPTCSKKVYEQFYLDQELYRFKLPPTISKR